MASNTDKKSISAYGTARSTVEGNPLDTETVRKMNAYFRASMYLCLGMLYLRDNPLLTEPLKLEHLKARLLGHWGSDAGQSFTWIHMNRLIKKYNLLHFRSRTWRPRYPLAILSRRCLLGSIPRQSAGCGGHDEVLQAILFPRWDWKPRNSRDAW
jgi:hypothetical protein